MGTLLPAERRAAAIHALTLSDELLARDCEESFFVASGPGGQHRNKTSSGVRLTHLPTGLSVTATERRSQYLNRQEAMERLREGLQRLSFKPKRRVATKPSFGSKHRRMDAKRRQGEKKANRRR